MLAVAEQHAYPSALAGRQSHQKTLPPPEYESVYGTAAPFEDIHTQCPLIAIEG
jgi:hypothetical protein